MRKLVVAMVCVSGVWGVESEMQFENEQVRVFKVKIEAHEELGLHRDEFPQVVVALRGGTMTRIEGDGSMVDVEFPKGEAVFRDADPVGQLHRSVNGTCKPMELVIVQLKGK
ncbi:MAG TPA: hypothetical protein VLE89_08485 [Chlamydiales bacterium]|nr:hypothetical protein [Chlamydiales bacterium]